MAIFNIAITIVIIIINIVGRETQIINNLYYYKRFLIQNIDCLFRNPSRTS